MHEFLIDPASAVALYCCQLAEGIRGAARVGSGYQARTDRYRKALAISERISKGQIETPPVQPVDPHIISEVLSDIQLLADAQHNAYWLCAEIAEERQAAVTHHRRLLAALLQRFGSDRCNRYGFDPRICARCLDVIGGSEET